MRRALEYVKAFDGVVAQHAEEPRLTAGAQMHEGDRSARLGLTGWPAAAEEAIIARDVLLAGHVGARLHVCHVSTAGSVELLRWAKARGVQVTAEVTPHHLLLTDACAESYDPVFKVNPPLRTDEDVAGAPRRAWPTARSTPSPPTTRPHAVEDKESEWAAGPARHARAGAGALGRRRDDGRDRAARLARASPTGCRSAPRSSAGWTGTAARSPPASRPTSLLLDPRPGPPSTRPRWPAAAATALAGRELPGRVVATFLRGVPTVLDGKAQR